MWSLEIFLMKKTPRLNAKKKEIKFIFPEKGYKITHIFSSSSSQPNLYFVCGTNLSCGFADRCECLCLGLGWYFC